MSDVDHGDLDLAYDHPNFVMPRKSTDTETAEDREPLRQLQLVAQALDEFTAEGSARYELRPRPFCWVEITGPGFVEEVREYRVCLRAVQAVEAAGGIAVATIALRHEVAKVNRVERAVPAALARFVLP